jgi:uncharacterized protein (TIGR03792 family)
MVIERLAFRVPIALQPRYLALDAEIWTAALAAQPGFLGKEYWAEAADPDVLHLVIRWASHDDWHAVPKPLLADTDRRFNAALGRPFTALYCTAYDVL